MKLNEKGRGKEHMEGIMNEENEWDQRVEAEMVMGRIWGRESERIRERGGSREL